MNVRPTVQNDIAALQSVLDETQLFPSEMLPELIEGFLSGNAQDIWLTCESDGIAIGFCYAAPEQLADGTWNMLAIAVARDLQGKGVGRAIVQQLEIELKTRGQRILIADTSGTDEFGDTRDFYRKNGYCEEARIRGFWGPGDDKVVFWKSLAN